MRQPQADKPAADTYDDIFGPPRTNSLTCTPPRHRISMISASHKRKEERRKVLKISLNKLKRLEDPEANLCRSVLINNTTLRLQQETQEEKKQKQKLNYPLLCDNDIYSNISNEMLKNEKSETTLHDSTTDLVSSTTGLDYSENMHLDTTSTASLNAGKRKFIEDPSEDELLSQFLITPTPTMLTEIDDKPSLNETNEDGDPLVKRLKLEEKTAPAILLDNVSYNEEISPMSLLDNVSYNNTFDNETSLIMSNISETDLLSPSHESHNSNLNANFSCGQASMFGEQQNNFYYSLVASLET